MVKLKTRDLEDILWLLRELITLFMNLKKQHKNENEQ